MAGASSWQGSTCMLPPPLLVCGDHGLFCRQAIPGCAQSNRCRSLHSLQTGGGCGPHGWGPFHLSCSVCTSRTRQAENLELDRKRLAAHAGFDEACMKEVFCFSDASDVGFLLLLRSAAEITFLRDSLPSTSWVCGRWDYCVTMSPGTCRVRVLSHS